MNIICLVRLQLMYLIIRERESLLISKVWFKTHRSFALLRWFQLVGQKMVVTLRAFPVEYLLVTFWLVETVWVIDSLEASIAQFHLFCLLDEPRFEKASSLNGQQNHFDDPLTPHPPLPHKHISSVFSHSMLLFCMFQLLFLPLI